MKHRTHPFSPPALLLLAALLAAPHASAQVTVGPWTLTLVAGNGSQNSLGMTNAPGIQTGNCVVVKASASVFGPPLAVSSVCNRVVEATTTLTVVGCRSVRIDGTMVGLLSDPVPGETCNAGASVTLDGNPVIGISPLPAGQTSPCRTTGCLPFPVSLTSAAVMTLSPGPHTLVARLGTFTIDSSMVAGQTTLSDFFTGPNGFTVCVTDQGGQGGAPINLFEIYSGCTNYTSRGMLATSAGDVLLQIPSSHFAGVGHDAAGSGTRLRAFQYVTQDQNATTPETYHLIARADNGGAPDCSAAGLLLRVGPLTTPSGTGTIAWQFTTALATPSAALPLCNTYYHGAEIGSANWTADGQSFHICTYYQLSGTQADNPAANAPNIAWNCMNNTPAQPPSARSIRFGLLVESAVLNFGNVDPTVAATNCVSTLGNRSFGAGGLWPANNGTAGPRNDGLDFRVRDLANGCGGIAVLFLGLDLGCPGLSIGSLADGALYLHPVGLTQIAVTALDSTGLASGTILPPGSAATAGLVNNRVALQAFTFKPATPGTAKLSNRASVAYLP